MVKAFLAKEETHLKAKLVRAERNDPCPCGSGKKRNVTGDKRVEGRVTSGNGPVTSDQ
jgi:hypothetical protein